MRNRAFLLLLFCLPMLLAGCWDRRELEENAFVLALGVDRGKTDVLSVTVAIALPAKMAGGGKGGGDADGKEKPFILTTIEAPTIPSALSMISSYVDRRVSLLHTKVLFMSEELARTSGLIPMDGLVRVRETRRTVFLVVTKGAAKEFMDGMDPKIEKDPQRFIEEMTYNYRATGTLPSTSQLQHFVTTINTGYGDPLVYYAAIREEGKKSTDRSGGQKEHAFTAGELPREGGPNIEMFGAAAFDRDRMVGVLTGDDTRAALMIRDEFRAGTFGVKDPKGTGVVSLRVKRARRVRLTADMTGPRPRIRGTIALEAELLSVESRNDYTEPEGQRLLEGAVAQSIANDVQTVISKAQQWNSDVFNFGETVVKQFATVDDWDLYDWPTRFKDADIAIDVAVTLRRFGLQLSPPTAAEQR